MLIIDVFNLQNRPNLQILILFFEFRCLAEDERPKSVSLLSFDHVVEASSATRIAEWSHLRWKLILLVLILLWFLVTKLLDEFLVALNLFLECCEATL